MSLGKSKVNRPLWVGAILLGLLLAFPVHPLFADNQSDADKKQAELAKKKAEEDKKAAEKLQKLQEQIEKKSDEFTGLTTFKTRPQWVVRQDFLGISVIQGDLAYRIEVPYKKNPKGGITPQKITLTLIAFEADDKYQNENALAFSLDGNPYPIDTAPKYTTEAPSGATSGNAVYEHLDYDLTPLDLQKLATATKIKGRVGQHEFEIKEFQQDVLRELYRELNEAPPATADPKKKA